MRLKPPRPTRVVGQVKDQYVKVAKTAVADDQVGIVLIETVTTAHTGAAVIDSTVPIERQVRSA